MVGGFDLFHTNGCLANGVARLGILRIADIRNAASTALGEK